MSGSTNSGKEGGFTIVELSVSITVMGVLLVTLLGFCTYFFTQVTRTNHMVEMSVDSQNLLRTAVEELRYGAGVRVNNTISDPHEPGGGWSTSNADFVIIIAVPAEDVNRDYIIDPNTGSPYQNELVYYRAGSILYKRTLAHPDAVGNRLVTSCPEVSVSPTCPADRKLVDSLDSMDFILYGQDNDDLNENDPSQVALARSVKIDLTLTRVTFGNDLDLANSIRVTLRNTF